ncbi:MAG: S-methyl-5-thioribose-1-phosphate isomerase [Alphaproteobacteria bacterium]|nr:S-methyl-5-thioribose-1-phosphate isomerase [Alphaproteobacteria bacterium]
MKSDGSTIRPIRLAADASCVEVLDQTLLPHQLAWRRLAGRDDAAHAIRSMQVRGAPLIGATAAFGLWLALKHDPSDAGLAAADEVLRATRPTAVNLAWALDAVAAAVRPWPPNARAAAALAKAQAIAEEDVAINAAIGRNGLKLFEERARAVGAGRDGTRPLNVLTHCNAGALACVAWGTATSPIYQAHAQGMHVHVWVDETRPRNQGANLTAWELGQSGVPHTVIVDNAGGHLMQHGKVDLCIVGTDRVTADGDVCNKIGTYLKALAAKDNGIPFYVALPSPTIDWTIQDGLREIPIEERDEREVTHIQGALADGRVDSVRLTPEGARAANYGFDVTPARLVSALITERGTCPASREGLLGLFPERRPNVG